MKTAIVLAAALLLSACSTPAIVGDQLGYNASEMLEATPNLRRDCRTVTTVTQTPSSWWSWVAPVRQVTTTLECQQ